MKGTSRLRSERKRKIFIPIHNFILSNFCVYEMLLSWQRCTSVHKAYLRNNKVRLCDFFFSPNAIIENLCLGPQCHSCPENWVWFRCSCYYFSKGMLTWIESQSACSSLNSSLIKINKEEMVSCETEHHNGMWNMWSRLSGLSWELFALTWPQH